MAIPKPKVFWPLVIGSTNNRIDFRENGELADRVATIASGTYYSAESLRAAVATALATAGSGGTWTVAINENGIFSIDYVVDFTLKFGTGVNAANSARSVLGFDSIDLVSTLTTATAPKQHSNGWYSNAAVRSDSRDYFEEPNSVISVAMGGHVKSIVENELTSRDVEFHFLTAARTLKAAQGSGGNDPSAIENWWRNGRGRFRYWPDAATESTSGDYFLDTETITDGFRPERMFLGKELYRIAFKMRRYV